MSQHNGRSTRHYDAMGRVARYMGASSAETNLQQRLRQVLTAFFPGDRNDCETTIVAELSSCRASNPHRAKA